MCLKQIIPCEAKKKKTILVLFLIGSVVIGVASLGIVYISHKENSQPVQEKNPKSLPLPEKSPIPGKNNCPYNEKSLTENSEPSSNYGKMVAYQKDLQAWQKIPRDYIVKLWKKGYHWHDIIQLWGWNLPEKDIPDLKTEKRIGVINGLAVMTDLFSDRREGVVHEIVVIVRKIPNQKLIINFDSKSEDSLSFKTTATNDNQEKVVNLTFQQEGISSQGYEISILNVIGSENFRQEEKVGYGKASGKSAGAGLYLVLLSALHQKPISNRVAATGRIAGGSKKGKTIDGKEVDLKAGDNLPIKGLKEKIPAAAEKGINILVLSKYQTPPNLLFLSFNDVHRDDAGNLIKEEKWSLKDDYQKEVSPENKKKMSVHWAENINQLRDLIFQNQLS